jgi:hypothetical protein
MVRRDGVPVWVRISASVVIEPAIGLPRLAVADVEDMDVRHDLQTSTFILTLMAVEAGDVAGFLRVLEPGLFETWSRSAVPPWKSRQRMAYRCRPRSAVNA